MVSAAASATRIGPVADLRRLSRGRAGEAGLDARPPAQALDRLTAMRIGHFPSSEEFAPRELYVQQVGDRQEEFLDLLERDLLPRFA